MNGSSPLLKSFRLNRVDIEQGLERSSLNLKIRFTHVVSTVLLGCFSSHFFR